MTEFIIKREHIWAVVCEEYVTGWQVFAYVVGRDEPFPLRIFKSESEANEFMNKMAEQLNEENTIIRG
jgi:hypothetical protein